MDFDEYESLPNAAGAGIHMTAGAIAGIMEHCIMYPLDSVKTRMQSLTPNPRATYRSVGDGLYKMMRYEGLMRPVRGMAAVVGGAGPAHALYFSCYEEMKRLLSTGTGHHHIAHGASGCVATVLHDAIMGPADVIKQRMQMYNSPYRNCVDCVRATYRAEGMRAFYRSYTTQLLMNVPFQCIHFMTYEFAQDLTNAERRYDPAAHMLSGAIAGGVAAAVTTPLDVCKTLLNTQEVRVITTSRTSGGGGGGGGAASAGQRVDGLLSALRCVYRCRGFAGYFQGLQARVLFQMPSTAIAWSIYEFFKFFLGRQQQQQQASAASSVMAVNSHQGSSGGGGSGSGGSSGGSGGSSGTGSATVARLQTVKVKGTAVEGVAAAKPR